MKKNNKFLRQPIGVKIALILFFLFFVTEVFIHLTPFFFVINNSLKTTEEYLENSTALTTTWAFGNYAQVFTAFKIRGTINYLNMLFNSAWQTFVYLIVNIVASVMVAYALAKFRFPGKGLFYGLLIFTQTIPIIGAGGAYYKLLNGFGMINNPATFWISWFMGFDYSCFILYGTFQGISDSYSEAAEIDGATQLQILTKIILPMVVPSIVALAVTNFTVRWNDFTTSQLYLKDYSNLAYGLYVFETDSSWAANTKGVYFASLVMTAVPAILLYAVFQNLIIKNISVGGLKG